MGALLALNSVEVVYDRVFLAAKGVSLDVLEGGLVAILGANGAGKSTVLKAISGLLKPERGLVTRGAIRFAKRDVLALEPAERVRAGIVHVLEGRRVFDHLTPRENLIAATSMTRDRKRVEALIDRTFAWFPRLADRANAKAGYLSGGEQQMLAIGRALMTEPRLLLLDEPSLGLSPLLVEEIFGIIRKVNAEAGVSVLLVEQNAAAALEVATTAYLLEGGRVIMGGSAADVRNNPDVQAAYLGGSHQVDYRAVKHYRQRRRWLS